MSWECRYKTRDDCRKLGGRCDPGRKGCVLYGKYYFPFAPDKNPPEMNGPAPDRHNPARAPRERDGSDSDDSTSE